MSEIPDVVPGQGDGLGVPNMDQPDLAEPAPTMSHTMSEGRSDAPVTPSPANKPGTGLRMGILGLILLSVVGIAVWGLMSSRANAPTVDAQAATPTTILDGSGSTPWGVQYNSAPGKPVLAIWEDFQCPYCSQLEQANGAGIRALADAGKVTLIWRPTVFLDGSPASQAGPNPNSSVRATMAWGCAIDAGKGADFHAYLFAHQPAKEGTGWTDDELATFASDVGITGSALDTFKACYTSHKYQSWVKNSYAAFESEGVAGTPAGFLNGTELTPDQLADPAMLADLVSKATN